MVELNFLLLLILFVLYLVSTGRGWKENYWTKEKQNIEKEKRGKSLIDWVKVLIKVIVKPNIETFQLFEKVW